MDHAIACYIGKLLSQKKVIDNKYEEVYVYGLELIISFISSVLLILVVAIITRQILSAIIFISIYVFLRRVTGGYHANTHFKCKVCTLTIYSLHLLLTCITTINLFEYLAFGIFGIIIILLFAPIANPNKPILDKHKPRFKILSLVIFVTLLIVGICFSFFSRSLSNSVFYTLLSVIVLMIMPKLKRRKKDENS
ncbi:MAG: accessory gene regulator B family protein [Clostridia bacterium]|nr:accessory gene regulator B family protein [Clostridia bacterium]